jgi:hypothetical protein
MCMHCFTTNTVNVRVLSEQKSSLKRQILRTVPNHNFHTRYQTTIFVHGTKPQFSHMVPNHNFHTQYQTAIFTHWIYTGQSCSFLTSVAVAGVQMGEITDLGWLVGSSTRDIWADSRLILKSRVTTASISQVRDSVTSILQMVANYTIRRRGWLLMS